MVEISTNYLGMHLKTPVVVSASPLSKKVENVEKLEEAGASAVVLYSLFEEEIEHESKALDYFLTRGSNSFSEAVSYYPDLDHYNTGPEGYLDHIERLKKAVSIPVIASLNGVSKGGWVDYARKIQAAGADALELNIYYIPTEPTVSSVEMEKTYVELVGAVREAIKIPLAVKLSPFITALPGFVTRVAGAGANGLVLFNRFLQPDLDIETLEVVPTHELSTSSDLRLPLRWVAILYGRIKMDMAITGGVHTSQDVLKSLMAGANVVMMASELIQKGPVRITEILAEMREWMDKHEYESVRQMRGSMSQRGVKEPAAFERANYMKSLTSYDNRV